MKFLLATILILCSSVAFAQAPACPCDPCVCDPCVCGTTCPCDPCECDPCLCGEATPIGVYKNYKRQCNQAVLSCATIKQGVEASYELTLKTARKNGVFQQMLNTTSLLEPQYKNAGAILQIAARAAITADLKFTIAKSDSEKLRAAAEMADALSLFSLAVEAHADLLKKLSVLRDGIGKQEA